MALKPVYQSKEEIPEGLASHYKEQADGTFKLQLEGGMKTQADVDRVKRSLQDERDKNEDLTRKLSKVPDDFDAETWDKVKDIDPDAEPSGDLDEDAEKQIQKRVAEQVRQKERDLKEQFKSKEEEKEAEVEQRKAALAKQYKESWIKNQLAEQFGFSDQKRLRWMMLDIEAGQHPELKNKIDSIEVVYEDGQHKIRGGDLKDTQGAHDILENISKMDIVKDYKPADGNSGGGANNNGEVKVNGHAKKLVKKDPKTGEKKLNITVAGQMYRENQEKARAAVSQAGFDPNEVFQE